MGTELGNMDYIGTVPVDIPALPEIREIKPLWPCFWIIWTISPDSEWGFWNSQQSGRMILPTFPALNWH